MWTNWTLLIGGKNWSCVNYLTFCNSWREWLDTSPITVSAWFNQILNWDCDPKEYFSDNEPLLANEDTDDSHKHDQILSLSYFIHIFLFIFLTKSFVKRFSFSINNRARRWLAGTWSDFPRSYFRFVHFIFQTKKFLSSNFLALTIERGDDWHKQCQIWSDFIFQAKNFFQKFQF